MRPGKVSENVLKRSVLKQIHTKREEVICGAGLGENCAVFAFPEGDSMLVSTHQNTVAGEDCTYFCIHKAVNNLAAAGAEPVAVELALLLPERVEEPELRDMMSQAEKACSELNIQLSGGSTKVSKMVNGSVATVTGIGRRLCKEVPKAKPGQDIVITKWIGLEGTALLAKANEEKLATRYPMRLIREAQAFDRWLSVVPEAATAIKSGVYRMQDASEGGIFGALWEFGRMSGVGLEIDLKKLPIRQETVEICEFLELNPYELLSGGCLILAADNGFDLVDELEAIGIPAVVAGKITENNDRVLVNEDERRFLDLPKSDEIYKFEI
jgi:hydrogenase maturation factor